MTEESPTLGVRAAFAAGPLLGVLGAVLAATDTAPAGWSPESLEVAGVAAWMAVWWVSEAVPVAATSLLPLALFPLLGVAPMGDVAQPYMHPFIVLLMAGFMAALAIERWSLHRRLALGILIRVGTSPRRLVLGMMIACAGCSMWISNTATALMLLPIGMALVSQARERLGRDDPGLRAFASALFLGIAYSASVGGLGTPIGTPPNLIFLGVYEESFPERDPIGFLSWMRFAIPLVVVMLAILWVYLTRVARPVPKDLPMGSREVLREELDAMGPMDADQRAVGGVFLAMALLWVTRRVVVDGDVVGWAPAFGLDDLVNDATVAVVGALVLFAWPSRTDPGERLLDWETARDIPWAVVLLFGGGMSLAHGFQASGLSEGIAAALGDLSGLPTAAMVAVIALAVTFLTEVTSNTATTTVLLPVLAAFSTAAGLAPEVVMIPAVLAASCAFMLPVATPPNAIVYGSGAVEMREMARAGFAVNLVGTAVITAWVLVAF
ncbi:MAG: SLC13 family permease [Myxococcota bacterium]